MNADEQGRPTWNVAFVGLDAVGLFLFERFSLHPNVRLTGVYDRDANRLELVKDSDVQIWDKPESAVASTTSDLLVFAPGTAVEFIELAARSGKQIVVCSPWQYTSYQLSTLSDAVTSSYSRATYTCLPRWSADFATALAANSSGRMGTLQLAHSTNWQTCLAQDSQSSSWREPCFDWLDQLLLLTDSSPNRVYAKINPPVQNSAGYSLNVLLEFANGCTAQLDLRTDSRLSLRTGWMLEGTTGSYRNHRIYTTMIDGEIVDEPFSGPSLPNEQFVDQLVSGRNQEISKLPSLTDAARIVQLIERIEESASIGEVVQFE